MTKIEIVWDCLKKHKVITSLEIQQLVWTTSPHKIIETLRKRYGYNTITDEWITTTRLKEVAEGKYYKETVKYKKYILNEVS